MLGQTKQIDVDTSETSSYASDEEGQKQPKKQKKPIVVGDAAGSDGDEGTSTYNKFKTQHEIEIGEAYKTGPTRLLLDDLDEIVEFGDIVQYIH